METQVKHSKKTVVFGADHAGFSYKELLKGKAHDWGYSVIDCGTHSPESVDYPGFIPSVVKEVLAGAIGILICGSGIGMSIGANRYKGIRAALCCTSSMAKSSRTHNDANILVLGERLISQEEALACLETFLNTSFENERHTRRVEKLDHLN
jgi:ribose 5-phosphate isomerase B